MVNALVETGTLELCERLEVVEWLGITPIFQDLEGPILTRLAGLFQLVECGADVALCEAGRPADSFWIIVHGRVHVSRPSDFGFPATTVQVATVSDDGDMPFFGETAVLEGSALSSSSRRRGPALSEVTVITDRPSQLLRVSRDNAHAFMSTVPQFKGTLRAHKKQLQQLSATFLQAHIAERRRGD